MIGRQQMPEELGRYALLGIALLYLAGAGGAAAGGGVRRGIRRRASTAICQPLLDPYALAAMRLTLLTAAITVPLNLVFGIARGLGRSPSSSSAARTR